jgi:two-component system sensor histidine kinase UhpB
VAVGHAIEIQAGGKILARSKKPDGASAWGRGDSGHDPATMSREELEVRLRWLEGVIALSPMAIWIADGDRIVYANAAAARLVGADSADAMVGASVFAMLDAADHASLRSQLGLAQTRQGHLGTLPARLVRRDGATRDLEIGLGALPDHGDTSVQMVLHDVTQRRRAIHDLEASRRFLRRLSANAVEAREEERRRIARELHDELGQSLTAMKMELVACGSHMGLREDNPKLTELLVRIDEIMASVRRLASDLRPQILDDLGLADAIEALAGEFSRRQGIEVRLDLHDLGDAADERVTIALYRMVQEALTNVARHAHATLVSIDLRRHDDRVALEVQDNGVGMPARMPDDDQNHYGVLGMQERADMLGGEFECGKGGLGGVAVRVRIPVRQTAPGPRRPAVPARGAG